MGRSSYEDDPRPCKDTFWNDLYVSHIWRCAERNSVIGCSLQRRGDERRTKMWQRWRGNRGGRQDDLGPCNSLFCIAIKQLHEYQSKALDGQPRLNERERDSLMEVSEVMMRQRRWEIIADASFFKAHGGAALWLLTKTHVNVKGSRAENKTGRRTVSYFSYFLPSSSPLLLQSFSINDISKLIHLNRSWLLHLSTFCPLFAPVQAIATARGIIFSGCLPVCPSLLLWTWYFRKSLRVILLLRLDSRLNRLGSKGQRSRLMRLSEVHFLHVSRIPLLSDNFKDEKIKWWHFTSRTSKVSSTVTSQWSDTSLYGASFNIMTQEWKGRLWPYVTCSQIQNW